MISIIRNVIYFKSSYITLVGNGILRLIEIVWIHDRIHFSIFFTTLVPEFPFSTCPPTLLLLSMVENTLTAFNTYNSQYAIPIHTAITKPPVKIFSCRAVSLIPCTITHNELYTVIYKCFMHLSNRYLCFPLS